jgi:hypothetical protein
LPQQFFGLLRDAMASAPVSAYARQSALLLRLNLFKVAFEGITDDVGLAALLEGGKLTQG